MAAAKSRYSLCNNQHDTVRNLKRRKKKKEDSTVNGRFRDFVNGGKRTRRRSGVRIRDLGREEARGEEAAVATAGGGRTQQGFW